MQQSEGDSGAFCGEMLQSPPTLCGIMVRPYVNFVALGVAKPPIEQPVGER